MGRSAAPGRRVAISTLLPALVIQPATAWSRTPPTFAPFPPETRAALPHSVEQHLAATGAPGAVVGVWLPGRGTWVRAQATGDSATLVPNAPQSIASRSGHYIQQEQPALVLEAIRQVVTGVRDPDTRYDLVSCCAR